MEKMKTTTPKFYAPAMKAIAFWRMADLVCALTHAGRRSWGFKEVTS